MLEEIFDYAYTICYYIFWFLVIIAVILYFSQNKLLYMPVMPGVPFIKPQDNPDGFKNPGEHDCRYQDVYITTEDEIVLHGWWLEQPSPRTAPTIIFFHANAGNMGFRMENLVMLYKQVGANVLIISYRGYGNSQGSPNEEGLMSDARATLAHLFEELPIDDTRVFLFGRSLGGAVAIYAAGLDFPIAGVIMENTFTNIADMVSAVMPKIAFLKFLILKIDWPSLTRIKSLKCRMLFISGQKDELVPVAHMNALYGAATEASSKDILKVDDGDHNNTWKQSGTQYILRIKAFVEATS